MTRTRESTAGEPCSGDLIRGRRRPGNPESGDAGILSPGKDDEPLAVPGCHPVVRTVGEQDGTLRSLEAGQWSSMRAGGGSSPCAAMDTTERARGYATATHPNRTTTGLKLLNYVHNTIHWRR